MARNIAPARRALLDRLIDYAGTFPPAGLARDTAVANYLRFRAGGHAWMLRWLVVGGADLAQVPRELDGSLGVLSDTDEPAAAGRETRRNSRVGWAACSE